MKKLLIVAATVLSLVSNVNAWEKDVTSLDDILAAMTATEIQYLHKLMDDGRTEDALIFIDLMKKEHKVVTILTVTK